MSQHDYIIDDQTGSSFRADLNSALSAIVSNNSGATEPTTTYAYQFWVDTSAGKLKQRNAANSAWLDILTLGSNLILDSASQAEMEAGTETANRLMSPLRVAQAIASLSSGLGVGQTWSDVSGSRTSGVGVTNSSGRPIVVNAAFTNSATGSITATIDIDGVTVASNAVYANGAGFKAFVTAIVPNGSTYTVTKGGSGGTISTSLWVELS